jgi:cytokine receptor domeless
MPENHVPVHYELRYSQGERKHLNNAIQVYDCESSTKIDNIYMCRFSDQKYRRSAPFFTFNLTAKNLLGQTTEIYDFDNWAHIIVDVPNEWKHDDPTDKSVRVKWELPKGKLKVIGKPFDYEISVECHCYGGNKSKIISLTNMTAEEPNKNFSLVIDLEYAYTWYDIKIRSKISMAENIEKMWSPWSQALQVKSKPRLPDNPPEINVGAFNILPNDDVYIYWKDVPQCRHNGDNFTYNVLATGQTGGSPTELKDTYAVYRKNKNLAEHGASVRIKSQNSVGIYDLPSQLIIPSKSDRVKGPKNLQKRLKNGTYIITWAPHENVTDIESYTIFWCTSKTEGENKCNDKSFNFHRIGANEEPVFRHKSDDTVNFAISVNTRTSTSGMTWTTCTTGNSNEIGKIKSIWIPRLSSTEIDIKWRLECTDMGIVAGYVIEYCPAKASKTFACLNDQEPEKLEIKENLEHTEYTLTGLAPYKTYGIYIRMFSNSTLGPRSDPLVNTTFQAGEIFF